MRRLLTFFFVALLSVQAAAQQVDSLTRADGRPIGVVSFRVLIPEGPLVQGDRVHLRYELVATHYKISRFDGGLEGSVLEAVNLEKPESGNPRLYRVVVDALCRITACGPLKVKPMSCLVDDERMLSDSLVVEVLPNPDYGQEWQVAKAFLNQRGAGTPRLEYKYSRETLYAFSDPVGKAFAIVARKEYQPYLENPILAFGVGNQMWSGDDDEHEDTIARILERYGRQLKELRARGQVYQTLRPASYEPNPAGVEPLLGDIEFAQSAPYNRLFPRETVAGRDSACVAGCGPVALAQILAYYRHPAQPKGVGYMTSKQGDKRYRVDFAKYPVRWDSGDFAPLMLDCAGSVLAEVGPSATSSSLYNFKGALIDNWDYSPQCTWIDEYYDFNMLAMLYREIDEGRPVIVADFSHLMVADGYYRDFIHVNLGWKGYGNGYYRAMIVPSLEERQLLFREMLIGIRPMRPDEPLTRKVNVREPGTLSRLLPEAERDRITKLVLTGKLDGDDIEYLRYMAGAPYRLGDYERGHGSLMELDLSRAEIVGGKPYAFSDVKGVTLNGSVTRNGKRLDYNYKLDALTDAQWEEILAWGINDAPTILLGKTEQGHVYIGFKAKDNVIGAHMFADCGNLRNIWLPKSVTAVEHEAFITCRALEHVYNLPKDTAPGAFKYAVRYNPQK